MPLPINIDDLIHGRTVESERLEFKKGWNPETVIHTICAFANDFNNWGGGYIIVGIDENDGQPLLPPIGLHQNQLDKIQGEVVQLANRISPAYFPICEPYLLIGKHILVLWCPAGENRPYSAPLTLGSGSQKLKYIRIGSHSIQAKGESLRQLDEMAARIPFDDRINHQATIQDLDLATIQAYLQEINSDLFEESRTMSFAELCRIMQIARGSDENIRPVNVGLLFFSKEPERFFSRSWIEVVWHKGETFTEHYFKGQLHKQLRDTLSFIKTNIIAEKVIKHPDRAEADRFYNFPYAAVEEVLANAVYHKSYELHSPIEVQIYSDKILVLSYPAAVPPVTKKVLNNNHVIYSRHYRNRRIGDFLKELQLTEGRATGLPSIHKAMGRNGSPAPIFDTDDSSFFLVTIPVHPMYNGQVSNGATNGATSLLFYNLDSLISFTNGIAIGAINGATIGAKDLINLHIHKRVAELLMVSDSWIDREQLLRVINVTNQTYNRKRYLDPLLEIGWIEMKYPDKLNHPDQGYRITESGKQLLKLITD